MLKLLRQVKAATQHQTVPPITTASVKFIPIPLDPVSAPTPDWWKWKIGVELHFWCEGAQRDREQLIRNARRAVAYEIFGEIEDEIRLVLFDLWREGSHQSKAADRLETLLPLLRGEDWPEMDDL